MLTLLAWHLVYLAIIVVTWLVGLFLLASLSRVRYEIGEWWKRRG